jgi:hypothetical protein
MNVDDLSRELGVGPVEPHDAATERHVVREFDAGEYVGKGHIEPGRRSSSPGRCGK